MSQLIPFDSAKLPSFVKPGVRRANPLSQGFGVGFPVLSIRGKTWAVVRSKEDRKVLMNPKDPDEPASHVSLVIIAANPALSRTYYEGMFDENNVAPPDCWSNDGVKPDPTVASPQAKSCAACKQAIFGPKGPPCATGRNLAVASVNSLDDPMRLRVPGASLKNLATYAALLDGKGVPFEGVVTKIRFDVNVATPKLIFEPQALISDELYQNVLRVAQTVEVAQILGLAPGEPATLAEAPAARVEVTVDEVEEVIPPKPAKAAPVVEEDAEEEYADDEEDEAPPPPPKKRGRPKKEPEAVVDLDEVRETKAAAVELEGLEALLAEFDD